MKRKWNELKIEDQKLTYIIVVDLGLVTSTQLKRNGLREKKVQEHCNRQ